MTRSAGYRSPRLGREVSDDGIGFAHHRAAVDHHGHLGDRVEGEKFRVRTGAEAAAIILALIGHLHLVADPKDLAHVERIGAAEDADGC